jgi:hypothetical protein
VKRREYRNGAMPSIRHKIITPSLQYSNPSRKELKCSQLA